MKKISLFLFFLVAMVIPVSALPVWDSLSDADTGNLFSQLIVVTNPVVVNGDLYFFGNYNSTAGAMFVYDYDSNTVSLFDSTNIITLNAGYPVFDGVDTIYMAVRFPPSTVTTFASYNLSTHSWTDLSNVDVGNWVSTTQPNSLAFDSVNGLVYIGFVQGKFGLYNLSDGLLYDLSASDVGNWFGTAQVYISFDSVHNLVYLGTSASRLGVYDPLTNIATQLTTVAGNNQNFVYRAVDDSLIIPNGGNVARYDIVTNTTTVLFSASSGIPYVGFVLFDDAFYLSTGLPADRLYRYNFSDSSVALMDNFIISNWLTGIDSTRFIAYDYSTARLYTLVSDYLVEGDYLGVLYDSNVCVENWVHADSVCSNMFYTVDYVDLNACGTTNSLPLDDGAVLPCSAVWSDLSDSDVGNFFDSYQIYGGFVHNGLAYFMATQSISPNNYPSLGVYDSVSGVTSKITAVAYPPLDGGMRGVSADVVNNDLYFSASGVFQFGVYDVDTGSFTDLSATDTVFYDGSPAPNWMLSSAVMYDLVVDNVHGYVFTGSSASKFGLYNISDGVWYNLANTDPLNWMGTGAVYDVCFDGVDKVYTVGNGYKFGVFNISDGVWYNLNYNNFSGLYSGEVRSCVFANGKLYVGSGATSQTLFGVYDPVLMSFTNLSSLVGGYDITYNSGLAYDSVNDLIYLVGSYGGFGSFNPSTLVWTDLSDSDTNDWASSFPLFSVYVDSVNSRVYTGHGNGLFGVLEYVHPDLVPEPVRGIASSGGGAGSKPIEVLPESILPITGDVVSAEESTSVLSRLFTNFWLWLSGVFS